MTEEVRRRTRRIQEGLLEEAGGTWSANEVARHLSVDWQLVEQLQQDQALLAVEVDGEMLYPRCQFTHSASGRVEGLKAILRAINTESPWTRLSVLLSPTLRRKPGGDPNGDEEITVIDALHAGRFEEALHAAAAWGRPGAD